MQTYEPGELIRKGSNRYTTKTHDSLIISNGKWIWNSRGVGGVSALDYLLKVRGMGFVSAVEMLAGASPVYIPQNYEAKKQSPQEKKQFKLPYPEKYSNNAIHYLQKRGISADVIKNAIKHNILYESRYWNPKSEYHNEKVCVFVGKDNQGTARFAAMRGINKNFKLDKSGSDKTINFCIPPKTACTTAAVFEAPIDALSHMTLLQMDSIQTDMYRLSLGGTAHVALVGFLERQTGIEQIILCLDNDAAGHTAVSNIKKIITEDDRFSHIKISVKLPQNGKDYNESLVNRLQLIKEEKQQSRPHNRAAISI